MMTITNLKVKGYRSLADVDLPLQRMGIFIGRNNAGKSSLLLALMILLEGTVRDISEEDFFIDGSSRADEMSFEAVIAGVQEYLPLCAQTHRSKIEKCLTGDSLVVRRIASRSPLQPG